MKPIRPDDHPEPHAFKWNPIEIEWIENRIALECASLKERARLTEAANESLNKNAARLERELEAALAAPRCVYGVFAAVRGGVSYDYLATYSSRERAQDFIDMQTPGLRDCLSIWEIELDRHTADEYWSRPE